MNKPILLIEGSAGAGGDMILAALVDLGFPIERLRETLRLLPVPLDVKVSAAEKSGLRAILLQPKLPKAGTARKLKDFLAAINKSKLPSTVREKSTHVFEKLADAEAKVHGKKVSQLRFHELGGWDTLLDIVGCVAGFEYFAPMEVFVGPLNLGSGAVRSEHGLLPVPAPAVLELLNGFSIYSSQEEAELVTPTGAAILSVVGKPSPSIPKMQLHKTAYGAGTRDLSFPNVLRILSGTVDSPDETILKLETNIDDMNPQFWEHIFEKLYEAGAVEVFLTPVVMKKSRPAHVLTVLAPPEEEKTLMEILFKETTTLGIRKEIVTRVVLHRRTLQVMTPYGEVPCKVGYENGSIRNAAPEYDAVKTIAKNKNIPLKKVYNAVLKSLE